MKEDAQPNNSKLQDESADDGPVGDRVNGSISGFFFPLALRSS